MSSELNLIQMAWRAGKIVRGDSLLPAISQNKAKLVVCSSDMGDNRKKKVRDKCTFYKVPLLELDPEEFSRISGRAGKALGITDPGFAQAILKAAGKQVCD